MENVAPLLSKLFAAKFAAGGTPDEDNVTTVATVALTGKEMLAAQRTVPTTQPRSLRSVKSHFWSFKAVELLYWLVSSGAVHLAW